jgi:2-keto-4-pentenoate hydratase
VNPDGADVAVDAFIWPRVEAEIALVLREDLAGPDCTAEDAARAVGGARAAIEIVDSRIQDWKIKLADTIADLASSGAIVLGDNVIDTDGSFDLRLTGMVFTRDGELVATGAGAAALGSPLAAVDIKPGQHYLAEFDRLGTVSLNAV